MPTTIEIFTMGSDAKAKVDCSKCPSKCASKDHVVITPDLLMNQLLGLHGDALEVIIHDYSAGDKEAILSRQNDIYKDNGIRRIVNPFLIGPLASKIWPSVVIDGKIKSEGVLLDATRVTALLEVL